MRVRPSLMVVRDGHILLLKYRYGKAEVFTLPGGNPEHEESLEETLIRELREELSLNVIVDKLLFFGQGVRRNADQEDSVLHFVFTCRESTGNLRLNPEFTSADEAVWLPLEQLREVNLYPNLAAQIIAAEKNAPDAAPPRYLPRFEQPWF